MCARAAIFLNGIEEDTEIRYGYDTDTVSAVDTKIRYGTGFYKNPYVRIATRIANRLHFPNGRGRAAATAWRCGQVRQYRLRDLLRRKPAPQRCLLSAARSSVLHFDTHI